MTAIPDRGAQVRCFKDLWQELGISRANFFANVRPQLPIMRLSAGRRGVLQSDWDAFKDSRREEPAKQGR